MMQDPDARRSTYIDLAAEELGGSVVWANDDFFASKDNLIKPSEPIWLEDEYTDLGKWMDGWESRRRRVPGNDYCYLKLALAGVVKEVLVDTAFFRGNYPDSCSLEGCVASPNANPEDLEKADWFTIVAQSKLEGNSKTWFDVEFEHVVTHLRFQIYPDGGVARLRVYGDVLPNLKRWQEHGVVDLASMMLGGRTIGQSDMFFGLASNMLKPTRAKNMGDGWETKRRRGPGDDWCVIKLSATGFVNRVEIDTHHFKGNFPDRFSLAFTNDDLPDEVVLADVESATWTEVIGETKLQAHTRHEFEIDAPEAKYALLRIYPDGGISRFRAWGRASETGMRELGVRDLNHVSESVAETKLRSCCGSDAWVSSMLAERPFASFDALAQASETAFDAMTDDDWLQAFDAHPKIGEKKAQVDVTKKSSNWSAGEQAGTADASEDTMKRLADGNAQYFEKFGFIFIVFASGKSAFEMLQLLEQRIDNDKPTEIVNAGNAQRKITALRLEKLVGGQ